MEDGSTEYMQSEQQKENKLKGNEQSFRDLGDYTKDVTFVLLAKNTQRNNGWHVPRIAKRHQNSDLRNTRNFKQVIIHNHMYFGKTAEHQRQRGLQSNQR